MINIKPLYRSDFLTALTNAAELAREQILICTYLIHWKKSENPDQFDRAMTALAEAARRKIKCKILTPSTLKTPSLRGANARALSKIIDAGWQSYVAPAGKLAHAKFCIFDSRIVIIGSHNLTRAASDRNLECSLEIRDPRTALNLEKKFTEWLKSALLTERDRWP